MSIYIIRTCLTGRSFSSNLCSHWNHNAKQVQETGFQLSSHLRKFLQTSKWTQSRQPVRKHWGISAKGDNYSLRRLWKPFLFTITVSGVSLAGSAIWQYENVRSQSTLSNRFFNSLRSPKYGEFRQNIHNWWCKLSDGDKIFIPICAINTVVFLAWSVPAWSLIMTKYFTSSLASNTLCWPMLLSVFSHFNFLHLAANMYCLRSFSNPAVSALGKEQFVGVYLSAGIVSSFTSYLYKALIRSPKGSLGASGAVMGMLGYICSKYPHSHLGIILLPQYSFEAENGLKAVMCLDSLGCILRWSFFDHAAHLGGSLFGLMWFYWGNDYIWKNRKPLLNVWHKFRGPL